MCSIISRTALCLSAAVLLTAVYAVFAGYSPIAADSDVVFAQATRRLRTVQTMQYMLTLPASGTNDGGRESYIVYYRYPGLTRIVMPSRNIYCVYDRMLKRSLIVYENFMYTYADHDIENDAIDMWHDVLTNFPEQYDRYLGVRDVNGQRAYLYQAIHNDLTMLVWLNDNHTPIQMHCFPSNEPESAINTAVIKNIILNEYLPDRLFSMEPPKDFSLLDEQLPATAQHY